MMKFLFPLLLLTINIHVFGRDSCHGVPSLDGYLIYFEKNSTELDSTELNKIEAIAKYLDKALYIKGIVLIGTQSPEENSKSDSFVAREYRGCKCREPAY